MEIKLRISKFFSKIALEANESHAIPIVGKRNPAKELILTEQNWHD